MKTLLIVAVLLMNCTPTHIDANPLGAIARSAASASRVRVAPPPRVMAPGAGYRPSFGNGSLRGSERRLIERMLFVDKALAIELVSRLQATDPDTAAFILEKNDLDIPEVVEFQTVTANLLEACDGHGPAQAFIARSVERLAFRMRTRLPGFTNEDLAQSFWTKFETLCTGYAVESEAKTIGLINTVLRNIVIDQSRGAEARAMRNAAPFSLNDPLLANGLGALDDLRAMGLVAPMPHENVEIYDSVRRLGSVLTLREREALGLRVMGYTYVEAAEIMGISRDRVSELLSSARMKARTYILESEEFTHQVIRR